MRTFHLKNREAASFRERKGILGFAVCFLSLLCLLVFIIPSAYATGTDPDDPDEDWDSQYVGTEGFNISGQNYEKLIKEMNRQLKQFDRLNSLFDYEEGTLLYDLMEKEKSPGRLAYGTVMLFSFLLIIVTGVMKLVNDTARGEGGGPTAEVVFRVTLMTVLALFAVIYIKTIINGIEEFGRFVLDKLNVETREVTDIKVTYKFKERTSALTSPGELQEQLKISGAAALFRYIYRVIARPLAAGAAYLVGRFGLVFTFYSLLASAYGAVLEMVLRRAIAPLAVSTLVTDGARSVFSRYMLGYFGMYLRIALIYISIGMSIHVQYWAERWPTAGYSFDVNWVLGPLGVCICARTAAKGLMVSGGDIIREVIGGQGG